MDGAAVRRAHEAGRKLDYLGASYLIDFFDAADDFGMDSVVITSLDGERKVEDCGSCRIVNLPKPWYGPGLRYHLAQIVWLLRACAVLLANRVRIAVVTDGQDHWFVLLILRVAGVRLVPALHCGLWTLTRNDGLAPRTLRLLNKLFFYRLAVSHCLSASGVISRQLGAMLGRSGAEVAEFLPIYDPDDFADACSRVPAADGPLEVVFAGRIVANKGVFDLVDAAGTLLAEDPGGFRFHICGDGHEFDGLKRAVERAGLSDAVLLHGFCDRYALIDRLGSAHVVVAPTRSTFAEGFAMICAEAVLAGRPVITSAVCPASEYIGPASVLVEPDDVSGYADALRALRDDRERLAALAARTAELRPMFYDRSNGYGAKLGTVLRRMARPAASRAASMNREHA